MFKFINKRVNMETEYDEPVLCNYYDTFSPYIDLTEKYKFV